MAPSEILRRQQARVSSGATRPAAARRQALEALADGLERHEPALLAALYQDLGKTAVEAFTSELSVVRMEIAFALRHLRSWMKTERPRPPWMALPGRARVVREPCGAVLIIGPWNYPVQLLLTPLVGALAAGCTAVLKPSERAAHTAVAVQNLIEDCFDADRVAICQGDGEVVKSLQRESFDHVFFTGSGKTGVQVMTAAARTLTPVTLELGGKCPVLVFPGRRSAAELERSLDIVARRIAWGKYLNAGQTCVAPDHVFVAGELHAPLLRALARAFDGFGKAEHARIINRSHFERLRAYFAQGRIAYGGEIDEGELKIFPTLLTDLVEDAPLMKEEIFGPILPVLCCGDLAEALRQIKSRPPPLAIYAFSKDPTLKDEIARETCSGGICFNDTVVQIAGPSLPFGGTGSSGIGRYRGRASFETFTRQRTLLWRPLWPDFNFRYPPAKLEVNKLKRLFRWLGGG